MNLFRKAIAAREITTEEELKRAFWKLAKKLHPDADSVASGHEHFIRLKRDYDEASALIGARPNGQTIEKLKTAPPSRKVCVDLFIDLLAGNFPVDRSIRNQKAYLARIEKMNAELGKFGPDFEGLFMRFEDEMYILKGPTVVSNHEYAVVKLYLYRFSDYTYNPTKNTEHYLKIGYELVRGILAKKGMAASIRFLEWLAGDIAAG